MSISGSLRTMAIEDLLSWIDRRRLTGTLVVERGQAMRRFTLADRRATGVSSNLPGEQLSQILLARELVTEDQLRDAYRTQTETNVRLGKVLLLVGAVTEAELADVLELQVSEALCDTLSWDTGTFGFERGAARVSEVAASVPLGTTIDLGVAQAARWREIRQLIPSDDVVLEVRDHFSAQDPGASPETRAQLARLVDCIERGLTVGQMVLEHHGRRLQVFTRLAELVGRGAVAAVPRPRRRRTSLPPAQGDVATSARERAARGDKAGALALVARALEREPEHAELRALSAELERSLFAELSRELLGRFRVPKLRAERSELDTLDLSDAERYLARRIDGRWDLLSLMRISPLRDVEALLTFKRLADRGIIEL